MKFQELKKELNGGGFKPIYLIEGEDAFLRDSAVKMLKDKYLELPDLNYSSFDGKELKSNLENFVLAVKSYPFMSEKRVVLLKNYNPTANDLKSKVLSECFSSPEETTLLIICNEVKNEQLKKFSAVTVVDCSKADVSIIIKWVQSRALKDETVIGQEASTLLAEYCQNDLSRISVETEKLIAYVGESKEITVEDVRAVVNKETDYQIYELVEHVARGNNDKAFATLKDMLDKNEDKQRLFISLYNHFRRLLHISLSSLTNSELAEFFKIKEYAVKKAREQTSHFRVKRLKSIVDGFSNLDFKFKSGELSVDDALFNSIFNILIG